MPFAYYARPIFEATVESAHHPSVYRDGAGDAVGCRRYGDAESLQRQQRGSRGTRQPTHVARVPRLPVLLDGCCHPLCAVHRGRTEETVGAGGGYGTGLGLLYALYFLNGTDYCGFAMTTMHILNAIDRYAGG